MKAKSKDRKVTSKRRTVRGPQMELVREKPAAKLHPGDAPFELMPYVSENEAAASRGVARVVSFRMSKEASDSIDALVAAHVAKTRTGVIELALAELAKRRAPGKVVAK